MVKCSQYSSYWNAFLFVNRFIIVVYEKIQLEFSVEGTTKKFSHRHCISSSNHLLNGNHTFRKVHALIEWSNMVFERQFETTKFNSL